MKNIFSLWRFFKVFSTFFGFLRFFIIFIQKFLVKYSKTVVFIMFNNHGFAPKVIQQKFFAKIEIS